VSFEVTFEGVKCDGEPLIAVGIYMVPDLWTLDVMISPLLRGESMSSNVVFILGTCRRDWL